MDFHKLRCQEIGAPWTPTLKDELDALSFHPDEYEIKDLKIRRIPSLNDEQQEVFAPFGPQVYEKDV